MSLIVLQSGLMVHFQVDFEIICVFYSCNNGIFIFKTCKVTIRGLRADSFYTLTMVLPVIAVTIMATMGMLLPAGSGEKMGLQITLLLTLVVFIQLLQDEVPFWQFYKHTPKILVYFVAVMGTMSFTIIISVWTLYLHHMNDEELHNFGHIRAKITIYLMKFNDVCSIGWSQTIPEPILKLSSQSKSDSLESIDKFSKIYNDDSASEVERKTKDDLRLCWIFLARQIDMTVYYTATVLVLCAAFAALTPVWANYTKYSSISIVTS